VFCQSTLPCLRSKHRTTHLYISSGASAATGAAGFLPVPRAERIKTRLSQTMGVELPSPGIGVFHLTLLVSLQVSGGSACGATPVASGPRHCGQKRSASEAA